MTTTITATALSDLAQLEQDLKTNLLQGLGTPVLTLLQAEQTALSQPGINGLQTLNGAWLVFIGSIPLALPNLGFKELQVLNAFAIKKLTQLMQTQPAPAAPAAGAKT